ncbi:19175_t:CDS:2, partial [Racocetra fulgida]
MEDEKLPESNDAKFKNKFSTYFHTYIILPFKKNPLKSTSITLVALSSLFIFILLVGSNKTIYLAKFSFGDPIKLLTGKNEMKFTLYCYCVDDYCTTPSLTNNFDKVPSPSEINLPSVPSIPSTPSPPSTPFSPPSTPSTPSTPSPNEIASGLSN